VTRARRERLRNGPQLISYPDSLGGNLRELGRLLAGPLARSFDGVHVLPVFPSSGDRGFAPIDYRRIDPAFGGWPDLESIAAEHDLVLDLVVNHVSRRSEMFADFELHGRRSAHADMFLTLDKVWPGGVPDPADEARIFRRRPSPFSTYTIRATGERERLWTTFGADDPSEQVDLDVRSPLARRLLADQLAEFASHAIRLVRLDAIGYVIKRRGTSCFLVEPEIDEFLNWLRQVAQPLGLELLTEVHGTVADQRRLAAMGHWGYDFALPGVVIHAILTGTTERLVAHLRAMGRRVMTTLDSHDGIPIQPDLAGALSLDEARTVADAALAAGGSVGRVLARETLPDPSFDVHQANVTLHAVLGRDDGAHLLARAIQLFAPGIPQVYYVGLLAGDNDAMAVARTGDGRAINRHDFSTDEIGERLQLPFVRRLLDLIELRRVHPAFRGEPTVDGERSRLEVTWRSGVARCRLKANLAAGSWGIEAS
jgi:sucrose phosphorylase